MLFKHEIILADVAAVCTYLYQNIALDIAIKTFFSTSVHNIQKIKKALNEKNNYPLIQCN